MNGALGGSTPQLVDPASIDFLELLLRNAHQMSRVRPITGPDADGVFPNSPGFNLLGLANRTPPVVPDTNVLRDDIRRTVSRGERGVLVNAANTGAIRLLCPAHVADEVVEHAAEFAGDLDVDDFLDTWRRDYLPLMRIVDDLDLDLFTGSETARINTLAREDPDDVPAAKIAIVAGGFFLSSDKNAVKAVYGPGGLLERDKDGHTKWVYALMGWGNAHELVQIIEIGALVARLVGAGVAGTYRRARAPPGLAAAGSLLAVGGLVHAYRLADPARRARLRRGLTTTLIGSLELLVRQADAATEIGRLGAPRPTYAELDALSGDARLTRSCIHRLARHPQPIVTAQQLTELLPTTLTPRGESKVRQVLRANDAVFDQPYRGWFQLGTAHPNVTAPGVPTCSGRSAG
ncbi:MAG: hypothetical protein AAB131_09995 [Actinomycetota bacterium]